MLDRTDPEYPKNVEIQKARMDTYWLKGQIGDVTYLRSLFILGYLPDEANTQLSLLKMDRRGLVKVL